MPPIDVHIPTDDRSPAGVMDRPALGAPLRAIGHRVAGRVMTVQPAHALMALLALALVLRLAWITLPTGALIADEVTYVNAARVIAGVPVPADHGYAGAPTGVDPHLDQPPLGKVLIGGSIALLGDHALAWRLPSLVAGLVALIALAGIVRRTSGSAWLAVVAVALLATDNLTFVHSRIATPDMPMVALALVGAWLALQRRWLAAGAVLAAATLLKPIAVFALAAALIGWAVDAWRERRRDPRVGEVSPTVLWPAVRLVGAWALVTVGGLWLLDHLFVRGTDPFDHLLRLFAVGFAGPAGERAPDIASPVWLWLVNERQFAYLTVAANTIVDGEVTAQRAIVHFQAAFNPVLIGMGLIAVSWASWRAVRAGDHAATWATIWVAATAGAWLLIGLFANRATFITHGLIIVPGLAVAAALLLARSPLKRPVAWAVLLLAVLGFAAYFPFREIPPPV